MPGSECFGKILPVVTVFAVSTILGPWDCGAFGKKLSVHIPFAVLIILVKPETSSLQSVDPILRGANIITYVYTFNFR